MTKPTKKPIVQSSGYGGEQRTIRVPKKGYDLDNLGPDAYPPGHFEQQNSFKAPQMNEPDT